MSEGIRRELLLRLQAAERRVERLESRQGLGTSQYLAGLPGVCARYFFDGTFVEELDPGTAKYAAAENQGYYHGDGTETTYGGPIGGALYWGTYAYRERWIYLRLERPLRLPAQRPVTFIFFAPAWYIHLPTTSTYNARLKLRLLTAEFSQAILEAMTWDNRIDAAEDDYAEIARLHSVGTIASGRQAWWNNDRWPLEPTANLNIAHSIRYIPAVAMTITGVRIRLEMTSPAASANRLTTAWIHNTKVGKPCRSFLLRE